MSKDGLVYRLHVPAETRCNMQNPGEWNIQFGPMEGATGMAFAPGKRQTIGNRSQASFMLSPQTEERVEKELSRALSCPLQDRKTREPPGVLNIDGLGEAVAEDLPDRLASAMTPDVERIEGKLPELPKIEIETRVVKRAGA